MLNCCKVLMLAVTLYSAENATAQTFNVKQPYSDSSSSVHQEIIPDSSVVVAGLDWLVPPNTSDSEQVVLYKKYLQSHPQNSSAKFLLGNTYIHLSDYKNAIAVMQELTADSLYSADAYTGLAYSYSALAESQLTKECYLKALEAVNRNIERDSTSARNYLLRGYINTRLNNYRTVLQDFDKCVALNFTDKRIYFWRGLARIALNQSASGCDDLYRAVKMGYGDPAARQLCYRCAELCKRYNAETNTKLSKQKKRK